MSPKRYPVRAIQRHVSEYLESRVLLSFTPTVVSVTPAAGTTNVPLGTPITVTLNLPNGNVAPLTATESNFYLYTSAYPNNNEWFVPGKVKTLAGGTQLELTPFANLLPNTSYTVVVTSGLTDVNGDTFAPFTATFKTAAAIPAVSQNYAFNEVALPTALGYDFTDVQIGPDGKLYTSTNDGKILRYTINSDGTLSTPQTITSLVDHYQALDGETKRLVTGFAFDPSFIANPSQPMLWVSNTFYALSGATNGAAFTGSLTVMSGPDLGTVTDAIIGLPRSVSDHVTDTPIFQPGTRNLFFCQAGLNAFGAADPLWKRSETLLSAAILEVNTSLLNLNGPALNVLTPDATSDSGVNLGGTYNPYASNAPLTIYATGIRNGYSLMFDDQGQLWAPLNGSSPGGNSPAGGGAPALTNVRQVQDDVLAKVVKGGYYGHPDPVRNQFVLDQGNPATGAIPGLAYPAYPVGTNPDPNYQLPNYIFGLHFSPNTMIEYRHSQNNAFGGMLDGKFLVANYSASDDITFLSRDSNNNIIGGLFSKATGPLPDQTVSGLNYKNLEDPLSFCEDLQTGGLYISEYGASKLTYWVPSPVTPTINASQTSFVFNAIAKGYTGAGSAPTASLTITNLGADPLTLNLSLLNDTADFKILNLASIPSVLANASNTVLSIQYTPSAVAFQSAVLQIKSNDPSTPTLDIPLNGIGTAGNANAGGTYNESANPSLVQVLRANGIPTIVGAGPNDVNINVTQYPQTPDPSSQEVLIPQLVAATSGPVTITPIGSFSASAQPVCTIGYYTPGNASGTTALFSINSADAQTLTPTAQGTTSFNPGSSAFGLYAYFPGIMDSGSLPDYHYSEDALNTSLDSVNPHKIRFFPDETSTGAIIPNAYVFAVEDANNPSSNSFDNFVGIIRNVTSIPAVPAKLATSTATGNSTVLTWNSSFGATSYDVQRLDPGSSNFTQIASGLTSSTFTDTNVAAGATYQYEVRADNAVGDSAFTVPVSATFVPATPANLTLPSITAAGVVLQWDPSSGATGYTIERLAPGAGTFTPLISGLSNSTYTDTNVASQQSYQYRVFAINSAGNSPRTAPVTAAVPSPLMTLDVTIGKGANKAVQFANASGTVTVVRMAGLGTAVVHFAATTISQSVNRGIVVVVGPDTSITGINTTGTSAANSVLTITTHGGANTVNIGGISADSALAAINAPTASLVGVLSAAGGIGRVALGSAIDAGINAPVLRNLNVRGAMQNTKIILSAPGTLDMASLNSGSISNTILDSGGSLGALVAGSMASTQIYAGTGATGSTTFPPVVSFPAAALISSVTLRKHPGAASDVNSAIVASRINRLSLGTVQFSNLGQAFGVEANSIGSLTAADSTTGKSFSISRLTSSAIVAAALAKKHVTPGDFTIDIV